MSRTRSIPESGAALAAWGGNFVAKITGNAEDWEMSAAEASTLQGS
jgi:hypothetical protein